MTVGFASLFGFPREMFAGEANLQRRIGRLARILNELNADYIDWLHGQARAKAGQICDKGEVVWRVHPFARQVPTAFLGFVATEIIDTLSGKLFGETLSKHSGFPSFQNDTERLAWLREKFLADGRRYLADDFSQLQGDAELVESKKIILKQTMRGLYTDADVARALDEGIEILKPYLAEAATALRLLGAHPPSVFLMGLAGMDSSDVVKRLADSVKGLKEIKPEAEG